MLYRQWQKLLSDRKKEEEKRPRSHDKYLPFYIIPPVFRLHASLTDAFRHTCNQRTPRNRAILLDPTVNYKLANSCRHTACSFSPDSHHKNIISSTSFWWVYSLIVCLNDKNIHHIKNSPIGPVRIFVLVCILGNVRLLWQQLIDSCLTCNPWQPPTVFCRNCQLKGPAALLSHRHVETPPHARTHRHTPPPMPVETLWITWYRVYPWKLDWMPQTPLAGQNLTCLSSLQLLLLNWSLHKTLSHCKEASEGGTPRHFLYTIFLFFFFEDMLTAVTRQAARPLLHARRPLKVFSFRTQGSHLLWNLIEGLFINFLSSKFLLQRKRWHTKKSGTAGCSVLRFLPPDASGRWKVYTIWEEINEPRDRSVVSAWGGGRRQQSIRLQRSPCFCLCGRLPQILDQRFWASQCESSAFCLIAAALLAATVLETLSKSCHIVYSQRPSPSLCGNLKLNSEAEDSLCQTPRFAPKKRQKSPSGFQRGAS